MNTGEGLAEAAARAEGEGPKHDTAVYWFSCTHKRQVQCPGFCTSCLHRLLLVVHDLGSREGIGLYEVSTFYYTDCVVHGACC